MAPKNGSLHLQLQGVKNSLLVLLGAAGSAGCVGERWLLPRQRQSLWVIVSMSGVFVGSA